MCGAAEVLTSGLLAALVGFWCALRQPAAVVLVTEGEVYVVRVHRLGAGCGYCAGEGAAVYGCAAVQGDRGVGEYGSFEDASDSYGRGAADLPEDVGGLRAVDQDNVAASSGESQRGGRHLEDKDRTRVALRVEGEIARSYFERVGG